MMARLNIDDSWIREIHRSGECSGSEYTFCGALEYRYKHIAKNWNSETRKKHEREYNNIILPALENHNEKTIQEYTKEDYENAIERIKEAGYEQGGVRYSYADSSINNFENLIYYVVFQSAAYGLCDNVLWGSRFVIDVTPEEEEKESRVLIKKSLSVHQEKLLCENLLDDTSEDGAMVALLLMWGLGLRNAEACGLNYGDIKQLDDHPDCNVAWIYKTTMVESRELQSGGKTYNTGRIIPIPEKINDFLKTRRTIVSKLALERDMEIDIDSLPICNDGWLDPDDYRYMVRCKARQVTEMAHTVFEASKISPKQVAYLDAELADGEIAGMLMEKDPTAYLLRRNFATQMSILGLSNAEMQYLIGHSVEDAYESRNEFVDSERIYMMYLKLKKRALLNNTSGKENKAEISIRKQGIAKVHISAIEPGDNIRVSVSTSNRKDIHTKWCEEVLAPSYDRTVNILNEYRKCYR